MSDLSYEKRGHVAVAYRRARAGVGIGLPTLLLLATSAIAGGSGGCSSPAFEHQPGNSGAGGGSQAGGSGGNATGGSGGSSGDTVAGSGQGGTAGTPVAGGAGGVTAGGAAGSSAGGLAGVGAAAGTGGSATAGSSAVGGSAGAAGSDPMSADQCPAAPLGAVTFSAPSGTFQTSISVTLTTAEAGAEIRYTTDHTPPNATSPLYASALNFTATTDLRAQAFAQGVPVGQPAAAVYVARGFDQAHDLPVMVLDSYGVPVPPDGIMQGDRDYIDAATMTFAPSTQGSLAQVPTVASPAGFHVRGQSSATYDKKPFKVEFREADGSDRNCPMLGMPRDEDWVLHSPYPDKALIRNAFVYSLGRELKVRGPRAEFVELYLNTAARPLDATDYQGVYLLTETIKNQKDRLNLQQLAETDIALPAVSGGYIFKLEYKVMDIVQELPCPSGQTFCWDVLEVADPDPWALEQQGYLSQYLVSFVNALHSTTPADPTTGYPALMDTGSFVDQVIVNEFTRNMDSYIRSQYFYKDRDGMDRDARLFAGPLWDYDLTFGVGTSAKYANLATDGWEYEANDVRFDTTADWFPVLLLEPTFRAALVARYKELRQGLLSNTEVTARVTRLTAGLAAGAARNFAKWPILTTARVGLFETPTDTTWEGQVAAMQTWMLARLAWLDTQWQ